MGEFTLYVDDAYFTQERVRHNRTATVDPTVNDDATIGADGGYAVDSRWFNTTTGKVFICKDATIGAALWEPIGVIDTWEHVRPLVNGSTMEDTQQSVVESGGVVSLEFEANGGGDVTFMMAGAEYELDCTPTASVALTAGTDADPQLNYVYVTESGGTLTLAASTLGWPSAEDFAPIATVLVPTAALVATDGVYKHHAWTDHIQNSKQTGHLGHINAKLRALEATWVSGCAPSSLVISSPDAHFTVDAGVVYQLHEHAFPAIDVSDTGSPGGAFVQNDPTTPYKHIHSFDGITQDASGGTVNLKWFPLVVWGVVSENAADCKLFINLPTGTYNNEALAQADASNYAVYTVPSDYRGTGFLIAKYVVKGATSGTWVESEVVDLRGLMPAISPGAGTAITDHGGLSGLGDDDHPQYFTVADQATHVADPDAHHSEAHAFGSHSDVDFSSPTDEYVVSWDQTAGQFILVPKDSGPAGADGATWYDGAGTPSAGVGVNDDYYLESS